MVPRLALPDDVVALLVGALVHALHHVPDLLRLQTAQVLVLDQGLNQELLHTVNTHTRSLDPLLLV